MIAESWSRQLGLAVAPLFGTECGTSAAHAAMLDGVAGSFVLSTDETSPAPDLRDLSWSSMMRHHVLVGDYGVRVAPSNGAQIDTITRRAVEDNLEGFLRYLESNGQQSFDVVDHVISTFQALRASMPGRDEDHLQAFLALLAMRLQNPDVPHEDLSESGIDTAKAIQRFDLPQQSVGLIQDLPADLVARFHEHLSTDRRSNRQLLVDLTIRHAGGELFQAAQLAPPVEHRQGELWGLGMANIRVRPHSLKEVAYTPVGLARSLAEHVVFQAAPVSGARLTVLDPACGSGSFLVEALAALARRGWRSDVELIGMDISESAIMTARFAVACAVQQGLPFKVLPKFHLGDFLTQVPSDLRPNIILMNPPFRAWQDMDGEERATTKDILGTNYRGRPDKSMTFVQRAVEIAAETGTIGVILPVGVVSGETSKPWRDALMEQAAPTMIAAFGDHSLFRFATVSVCALVLDKRAPANDREASAGRELQMVWASERTGAASHALRTLRQSRNGNGVVEQSGGENGQANWNLYPTDTGALHRKPNWLPAPGLLSPAERRALDRLDYIVEDLFHVRTGVRAGERQAFLLDSAAYEALPKSERQAFRPVAEKQAIANGRVEPALWLFEGGQDFASEAELKMRLPRYYEDHLAPFKDKLSSRTRIAKHWWEHSEARNTWKARKDPRIVSRQWFRNDGFAVDVDGSFAVVQGYAWFPKQELIAAISRYDTGLALEDILRWYAVMMSSDVFFRVCREYSTGASGGQISLQQKYLRQVPLPLLPQVAQERPHLVDEVARWEVPFPPLETRNRFASMCYGFPTI